MASDLDSEDGQSVSGYDRSAFSDGLVDSVGSLTDYGSEEDDDGWSDSDSSGSTLPEWEAGEPWDAFEARARAFAYTTVFPGTLADDVIVERHEYGNAFDHGAIRIARAGDPHEYLLRVPYPNAEPVRDELARIRLVQQHHGNLIPTLDVIRFDEREDNVLNSPYMLHPWESRWTPLIGADGYSIYREATVGTDGQCHVARQLGQAYGNLLQMQSLVPGKLVLGPDRNEVRIVPFTSMRLVNNHPEDVHLAVPADADVSQPYTPTSNVTSSDVVLDTMMTLFNRFRDVDLAYGQEYRWRVNHTDRMMAMAKEIADMGYFKDMPVCFSHPDVRPTRDFLFRPGANDHPFAPRNLHLVGCFHWDTEFLDSFYGDLDDPRRPRDWERAVIAPAFVTCIAPCQLWAGSRDEGRREYGLLYPESDDSIESAVDYAYRLPLRAKHRRIKETFDDAAGPLFTRYAYDPVYVLARRLWRFALEGIMTYGHEAQCRDMLALWDWLKRPEIRDLTVPPGVYRSNYQNSLFNKITLISWDQGLPRDYVSAARSLSERGTRSWSEYLIFDRREVPG